MTDFVRIGTISLLKLTQPDQRRAYIFLDVERDEWSGLSEDLRESLLRKKKERGMYIDRNALAVRFGIATAVEIDPTIKANVQAIARTGRYNRSRA